MCFEKSDEEIDKLDDDSVFEFISFVSGLEDYFTLQINKAYDLCMACIKDGYNEKKHGYITFWILHKVALIIEEYNKGIK